MVVRVDVRSLLFRLTHRHVVVEDSTGLYDLRGGGGFRGSHNPNKDTFQGTGVLKLQLVARGSGRVESANQTVHITGVNGNFKDFSFGTCHVEFPPEHGWA